MPQLNDMEGFAAIMHLTLTMKTLIKELKKDEMKPEVAILVRMIEDTITVIGGGEVNATKK